MILGYNTNGFAHHRLEDAFDIIAELGYGGMAVTPDIADFTTDFSPAGSLGHTRICARDGANFERFYYILAGIPFRCVVETGARFLLNSREKHQPTLLSSDDRQRNVRLDYLHWSIGLASRINSKIVSFWSGSPHDDASPSVLMDRLVESCKRLADFAAAKNVRLAFEPEPGMFIDTMDKFAELHQRVNHPAFGLTIDVGHLVCNGELPVSKHLKAWQHVLWNVHIEDMKRGVHDHIMFGEGEVDFADVFAGLREANYQGGVYVELSRHSHDAVNTARKAKAFLDRYL